MTMIFDASPLIPLKEWEFGKLSLSLSLSLFRLPRHFVPRNDDAVAKKKTPSMASLQKKAGKPRLYFINLINFINFTN
jgi:hypothetical protein